MQNTPTTVTLLGASSASAHEAVPLYASQPQAGFPSPGDDQVERTLDIHDYVVTHPASTFFVRVSGDSMEGTGIFSGDVLVVDRSVEPVDGRIVVAAVYGELVVKRVVKRGSGFILRSEHESYEPIVLTNNDDCYVWGVVVGSVRKFL